MFKCTLILYCLIKLYRPNTEKSACWNCVVFFKIFLFSPASWRETKRNTTCLVVYMDLPETWSCIYKSVRYNIVYFIIVLTSSSLVLYSLYFFTTTTNNNNNETEMRLIDTRCFLQILVLLFMWMMHNQYY